MSKDDATITLDMDRTCAFCRQPGALPSGVCMTCAMRRRWTRAAPATTGKEPAMGEITNEIMWTETRYLPVPLTPDELRERGEMLADLVRSAAEMETEHADERKGMKEIEKELDGRILHLAAVVHARAEQRSVKVEIRYNATLALVEEVRTDTGEVLETRQPTSDDKARAQMQAQPGLL